jgi:hypothetical protein
MYLPLFPLQAVVFPEETMRLHVFEPRYKQLIGECREHRMTFGLPPFLEGKVAQFGTEMRLLEITHVYEDGRMDIVVQGRQAFRLERFDKEVEGKLYSAGDVTFIENEPTAEGFPREKLVALYMRFHELFETGHVRKDFDSPNVSYQIAQEVGMDTEEKAELLGLGRESERLNMLIEHLQRAIPVLEAAMQTRKRVRGNGKFQKFPEIEL